MSPERDTSPMTRALDIIEAWAATRKPFSANTIRPEMDAANVPGPIRGQAIAAAHREGTIRRMSLLGVVSSQRCTHGKRIDEWIGAGAPGRVKPVEEVLFR